MLNSSQSAYDKLMYVKCFDTDTVKCSLGWMFELWMAEMRIQKKKSNAVL